MVMLMLLSLGSCNSFLDINPEGELIQDEQFKDVQGYRDAMYGIYAFLPSSSEMNTGCLLMRARGGPLVNMLILSMPRFIIIRISGWESR